MGQHPRLQELAARLLSAVATSAWILLLFSGLSQLVVLWAIHQVQQHYNSGRRLLLQRVLHRRRCHTNCNTSVSSGVVTSLPMLGNTTTTSGGVAGSLAGTIASDGAMTITAGGAGTTATGQVVLSIEVD